MANYYLGTQHPLQWQYSPFPVCFVERGQLIQYANVDVTVTYPDFLAVLHELTTEVAHNIPDLPVNLDPGEGLSLRDGPWWYRIIHAAEPSHFSVRDNDGWRPMSRAPIAGRWKRLNNFKAFERLRVDFVAERRPTCSWIEYHHELQKNRDEQRPLPTPFRRNGPVIVDGSKIPSSHPSLEDSLLTRPLTSPAGRPAPTPHVAQTTSTQPLRPEPPRPADGLTSSAGDIAVPATFVQYSYPTKLPIAEITGVPGKTVTRTVRGPPLGTFYPPKPRQDQSTARRTRDQPAVAASSRVDNNAGDSAIGRVDRRNLSIITNPYPDDPPVPEPEPYGEGPGPAVPTSPPTPAFTLGSPEVSLDGQESSVRAPLPRTSGPRRVNFGNTSSLFSQSRVLLDPALDINQPVAMTRRPFDTGQLRRSARIQAHFPNMTPGFDAEHSSINLTDPDNVLPQRHDGDRRTVSEPDKRKAKQRERHRQSLREAYTHPEPEKATREGAMSKEQGRVQDAIHRQRAERQKRAERRFSRKGQDPALLEDEIE